jgi:hypothetical protein
MKEAVMKKWVKKISLIFGITATWGCNGLLQGPPANNTAAEVFAIASDACNENVGSDENARGIISLKLFQDYVDGNNVKMVNKAFITSDKIGVNPYMAIGDGERTAADRKKMGGLKKNLVSLGASLEVNLAKNSVDALAGATLKKSDIASIRKMMNVTADPNIPDSNVNIPLKPVKTNAKFYVSDQIISSVNSAVSLGKAQIDPLGGFMGNRGLILTIPGWIDDKDNKDNVTQVSNIPDDLRDPTFNYAKGFKDDDKANHSTDKDYVSQILIPVVPDVHRLKSGKPSYILVQLEELNPKLGTSPWKANCFMKDVTQATKLPIPLKPNKPKADEFSGMFRVSAYRLYPDSFQMSDANGGTVLFHVFSGFSTVGSN